MAVPEILLNKENFPDDNLRQLLCKMFKIGENDDISDIAQNTEHLELINPNYKLSGLTTTLRISSNSFVNKNRFSISSLKGLEYFTNLKSLKIIEIIVKDISVVKELTKLEKFGLQGTNTEYISVLKEMVNLKELYLTNNHNIVDISVLEKLVKLEVLNLINNNIVDISVLKKLRKIKKLILSENEIEDISVLKWLKKLNWLFLSDNNITDISVLLELNLENLECLCLEDNKITDKKMIDRVYKQIIDNDLVNSQRWGNALKSNPIKIQLPKCDEAKTDKIINLLEKSEFNHSNISIQKMFDEIGSYVSNDGHIIFPYTNINNEVIGAKAISLVTNYKIENWCMENKYIDIMSFETALESLNEVQHIYGKIFDNTFNSDDDSDKGVRFTVLGF